MNPPASGSAVRGRFFACLLFAFLFSAPAAAQSLDALFVKANEAYLLGDAETAARGYEELIEAGVDDADVHFNLALCYNTLNQRGRAIVALERALRARPSDAEARDGLERARRALAESQAERRGEASFRTTPPLAEALFGTVAVDTLAAVVLSANALLFGLLWMRRREPRATRRLTLAIAASVSFVVLATSGLGLGLRMGRLKEGREAIVIADGSLKEGPDPRARGRGDAYEGLRVRIVERAEGFARVRLEDGRTGWLTDAKLETIAIRSTR